MYRRAKAEIPADFAGASWPTGKMRHPLRSLLAVVLMTSAVLAPGRASGFDEAATAVNALGLDLLRHAFPSGNAALSPYSIQLSLAMVYGGAAGKTMEEMRKTLHYPASESLLHDSFAELQNQVMGSLAKAKQARQSGAVRGDTEPMRLLVANRLFAQQSLRIEQPFVQLLKVFYGAPPVLLDFGANPSGSQKAINAWFADQTQQRIQSIMPKGAITKKTRVVLANAVYFKGEWQKAFSESETRPRPFYLKPEYPVDVPTMKTKGRLGYDKIPGASIITIPFTGYDLELVLMVPDPHKTVTEMERKITPTTFAKAAKALDLPVILFLPKFRVEPASIDLAPFLKMFGMRSATSEHSADFSRISVDAHIHLGSVYHQSRTAIDEHGAEAAAGTAATMRLGVIGTASQPEPKIVKVNRPFLFCIQHQPSGACLFLGRVMDPR